MNPASSSFPKTPAFWYAGKYLTYWDEPINSDAIVILSGNGGSNYINTGYQKRYLDVKKLVKKGDFKFIYLTNKVVDGLLNNDIKASYDKNKLTI